MRVGVVAVGIKVYENSFYQKSSLRLKYAVEDALAFANYAKAAWSRARNLKVIPLLNGEATREGFDQAIDEVADLAPDVFVCYLAGHGGLGPEGAGWFCLTDAEPSKPSLTAAMIDAAFERVEAKEIVFLLDCCHAEAVLDSSRFFSTLGSSTARLFLCSSRASQKTWEDDDLRHGIFSDVLIAALSSASPLSDPLGFVDVEGSLFPHLCEQVPLLTFSKKGGRAQEPVKGGVSARPIKFPTASIKVLGRQISTYQAAKAGLWRLTRLTVFVFAAFLVVSDLTLYHLALGASDVIEVRSGLYFINPLRRLLPGGMVDTGIKTYQLDLKPEENKRQALRLVQGRIWGFALHTNDRWTARLIPLLNQETSSRIRVLLGNSTQSDSARPNSEPWSAALAGDKSSLTARFNQAPDNDIETSGLDCRSNQLSKLDFNLLQLPPEIIRQDITRLLNHSRGNTERFSRNLFLSAVAIAYRHVHTPKDSIPFVELETLARGALYLISQEGFAKKTSDHLKELLHTWCGPVLSNILMVIGDQTLSSEIESGLVKKILSFDISKQGDLLSPDQETALNMLAALARIKRLSFGSIESIARLIDSDKRGVDGDPELVNWLLRVARFQSLPPSTVDFLQKELRRPAQEYDFHQLTAFTILASNARYLQNDAILELSRWAQSNLEAYGTFGDYAEAVSFLGLVTNVGPEIVEAFARKLVPEVPFPLEAQRRTERGTVLIERENDFKHGVALGRLAQAIPLPDTVIDKLYSFAFFRRGIPDYDQIIAGLAAQQLRVSKPKVQSLSFRGQLADTRSDSVRRAVLVEIICANTLSLDESHAQTTLQLLRTLWSTETEPEIKIALGEILARVHLRIVGFKVSQPVPCRCQDQPWTIGPAVEDDWR